MIKIINEYPTILMRGMTVKVINAQDGAKGAEGKIGIYLGVYPDVDISDVYISNGLVGLHTGDIIVKLEHRYLNIVENKYWNIGEDATFEIIDNVKRSKRSKEIIMEVRKENSFIKNFEISKSGRGVKVNFTDGTYKKTYALESDEFSLKRALFIAIAKKLESNFKYKDIEKVADAISIMKIYIEEVDAAIERYEKEEESKRIVANRKAKKIAYKERREARVKEELIEIQKEAYLRAMREANK